MRPATIVGKLDAGMQPHRVLDIEIDDEHPKAGTGQNAGDVDAEGGLAHTPLG